MCVVSNLASTHNRQMSDDDTSTGEVLDPQETSNYVKVPLRTLDAWRYRGTGPAYLKVGRHVRYRRADLDAWLDAQRVTPAGGGLSA